LDFVTDPVIIWPHMAWFIITSIQIYGHVARDPKNPSTLL
jgi:hypothetical protein